MNRLVVASGSSGWMKTLFSRHSILNDELPAATCVTGSPSSITLRWFCVVPSRVNSIPVRLLCLDLLAECGQGRDCDKHQSAFHGLYSFSQCSLLLREAYREARFPRPPRKPHYLSSSFGFGTLGFCLEPRSSSFPSLTSARPDSNSTG